MARNKIFWIIRRNIMKKHPNWYPDKVFAVTDYYFRKNTK